MEMVCLEELCIQITVFMEQLVMVEGMTSSPKRRAKITVQIKLFMEDMDTYTEYNINN